MLLTCFWHFSVPVTDWQYPHRAEPKSASHDFPSLSFQLQWALLMFTTSTATQKNKHPVPSAALPTLVPTSQGHPLGWALHTICLSWLTFGPGQCWNLTTEGRGVGGCGGCGIFAFWFWMYVKRLYFSYFVSQSKEVTRWLNVQDLREKSDA